MISVAKGNRGSKKRNCEWKKNFENKDLLGKFKDHCIKQYIKNI